MPDSGSGRKATPIAMDMRPPVSLYLHVPFCTVKCGYCDFNSYASLEEQIPAWETALQEELSRWAPAAAGRPVATLFFGGGTPSLLDGDAVARITATVRSLYALDPEAEVTLEANPESVRRERLLGYRAAGVNRLSMGVQSLDTVELRFLDRAHNAEQARTAFTLARDAGFDNVNVDLIFGLPDQTLQSWRRSLESVLAWRPDHLSCYALTVEEGTPLAWRVARGEVTESDPDLLAAMTDWTEERLEQAGYRQYEISNFARPGRECRHNLVYWRHQEYVAVGPGAHGFVDGVRYSIERSPLRYIQALGNEPVRPELVEGRTDAESPNLPSPAIISREDVTPQTAAIDAAVMGLRLNEGIDEGQFASLHGEHWGGLRPGLEWGIDAGLLERGDGRLRLTRRGRRLANEVFVRLLEPSLVRGDVMAYDEALAQRVRALLADDSTITERKMFGGLAFMLRGKMCVGVQNDELMVRVGPVAYDEALARPHAREMDFTGRPLRGLVYVAPAGLRTRKALVAWVERGVRYAASLPVK